MENVDRCQLKHTIDGETFTCNTAKRTDEKYCVSCDRGLHGTAISETWRAIMYEGMEGLNERQSAQFEERRRRNHEHNKSVWPILPISGTIFKKGKTLDPKTKTWMKRHVSWLSKSERS